MPQPPAILQIVDTLEPGGAERVALNLANSLPRDRFSVFLCASRRGGALEASLARDVFCLRLNRSHRFDVGAILRLRRFLLDRRISLIHAHGSSLFLALAASAGIASRVLWHDHFGVVQGRPEWLYRGALKRIEAVIAVTRTLAARAVARLLAPPDRVWYIPNFVQDSDKVPTPSSGPNGAHGARIVCVANLRPVKNHPGLLGAMRSVLAVVPGATLLLAGNAENDRYKRELQTLAASLGIGGSVSFLGACNDVPALLSGCDVAVLPSLLEGFPVALVEYGLAGLPVVATDVGEGAEVLDSGNAGLLVPPGDETALAAGLLRLLRDSALRATLGARLKQRVRARYTSSAVVPRIEEIYDCVLSNRARTNSREVECPLS